MGEPQGPLIDDEAFGEYRLLRPLGRGGMGLVYVAHDPILDRAVAIKLIATTAPSLATRERFLIEARAIARLTHPNVVTVYRAGETADGRAFLVQELVRGRSLDRLTVPVPADEVRRIGIEMARGLAAAHRNGVLHRDLKPANVMLADDGTVKLLDFGLAKLRPLDQARATEASAIAAAPAATPTTHDGHHPLDGTTWDAPAITAEPAVAVAAVAIDSPSPQVSLTQPGAFLGTPRYMAPEQWRGDDATEQTDLYALGAVLFELVTGRPVHPTIDPQALRAAVVDTDAPALASVVPDIDPALAAAIDRALARDRSQRPDSADAMAHALAAVGGTRERARVDNPYRGLAAFGPEDQAMFFGRSADVGAIVDRLRHESAVVIAGDSGVGKSSLCRAGVVPAITAGDLGRDRTWAVITVRPGPHPVNALVAALATIDARGADVDAALTAATTARRGLVVFVDQAEELITQAPPVDAERFAAALTQGLARNPAVRVMVSVRGDFVTRLADVPGLAALITRGLHLVGALDDAGRREAIVGPARLVGVEFEPAAVDGLVADSRGRGGLPLLQFALATLWHGRATDARRITLDNVRAIGGVAGALARHADGVIAGLDPDARAAARRLLTSLVTAEGTSAIRDAAEIAIDDRAARTALDTLIDGRLIVARDGVAGAAYGLAHDALIAHWSTLVDWLADDVGQRARHQRLAAAASEWDRLGRGRDGLLTGRLLTEANQLEQLTARESALVIASRRAQHRRRLRTIGLISIAATAVVAAWLGTRWVQRRDRDRQVAIHVTAADAALTDARHQTIELDRRRQSAFEHFDRSELDLAHSDWLQVQALTRAVRRDYTDATSQLESALLLDVRHELRARMAAALLDQARLAEASYDVDGADEFTRRIAGFDPATFARWSAPAQLAIVVIPAADIAVRCMLPSGDLGPPVVSVHDRSMSVSLPAASCIVTATAPGYVVVRAPIVLARGSHERIGLTLPALADAPSGLIYVPAGRFLFGSTDHEDIRLAQGAPPAHPIELPAYWIARYETTFAEWITYLNTLPAAEQAEHRPHSIDDYSGGIDLTRDATGSWTLHFRRGEIEYVVGSDLPFRYRDRTRRSEQRWQRFPVAGVSYRDAMTYAAWLRATGRIPGARLCTTQEWERAARGADQRRYPHGDVAAADGDDFNHDITYGQITAAFGPDEVGAHPVSDSPFGVSDLAGNVWEFVTGHQSLAFVRGGSWYADAFAAQSTNRWLAETTTRDAMTGVRICADAR